MNKVFRLLVQSNMEGFSELLVLQSECWSAGSNTSRTLEVGFLDKDSIVKVKKIASYLTRQHTSQVAGAHLWFV